MISDNIIATNRAARHDYFILETFEAGLQLTGCEVKSLRNHTANLKDSFAKIENGEVFLHNLHISPYEEGGRFNLETKRTRKLLLNKKEIKRLIGLMAEKGLTVIPLSLYFKKSYIKVEIAVVKGKRNYDKRQQIVKESQRREIDRALKFKNRG
ncbi:MAG: SsrA-binding protein SmpB [Candidatus Omnitrophota bacterium]